MDEWVTIELMQKERINLVAPVYFIWATFIIMTHPFIQITSFGCSNKFYPTSKREFTPIGVSYGLIWEKKSELTDLLGKYDYLALNFVCFSPWWIWNITFGHVAKMV
jgi:hypothetical protein